MSQTVRRTQAERTASSTQGLLAAAAGLVAEHGVAAVTLEKLGARSGYSRGLATQKFGSKQGLIEALIAHLQSQLEGLLADAKVDELPGLSGVLAFADIFLAQLEAQEEVRAYFMLLAGSVAEASPARRLFAASHDMVRHRLAALVAAGQRDGTIRGDLAADATATLIGTLLLGLSTQRLVDPAMPLDSLRDTAASLMRASLEHGKLRA